MIKNTLQAMMVWNYTFSISLLLPFHVFSMAHVYKSLRGKSDSSKDFFQFAQANQQFYKKNIY